MNCHVNKPLVLIFFTLLGLVGCGGGGSSASSNTAITAITGIATSSSVAVVSPAE